MLLMEKGDKIYCDNPQCNGEITSEKVLYNSQIKEIYHNNYSCVETAEIHRVINSGGKIKFSDGDSTELITRKSALELLRKGELKQSKNLEEAVI